MCILNSYIVCWFHWIFIISIQTATFGKYIQRCVRKYFGASFWTKLSQPAERLPFYYKIVKLSKPLGKYWRLDGRHLTSLVLEKKPNSKQETVLQFRIFFNFLFSNSPGLINAWYLQICLPLSLYSSEKIRFFGIWNIQLFINFRSREF